MKKESLEVTLEDVRLCLVFTVSGKYIPATYSYPEEHPDFEILEVTTIDSDMNILSLLSTYEDELYQLLQQNYEH